jgi:hypothetical protein
LIDSALDIKNNTLAKERFSTARKGLELAVKVGLSIGYMTIKAEPDSERPAIRLLKELKLWEHSMVPFAMNTEAMVTAAKNWKGFDGFNSEILAFVHKMVENGKDRGEILKTLEKAVNIKREPDASIIHSLKAFATIYS